MGEGFSFGSQSSEARKPESGLEQEKVELRQARDQLSTVILKIQAWFPAVGDAYAQGEGLEDVGELLNKLKGYANLADEALGEIE